MRSSIIVLAAGASRRMGRPKPLLAFDGRTCLSLVLGACLRSRAEETILVLGADADRVRPAAEAAAKSDLPGRMKAVVNERYERGQTSTLKTGLEAVSGWADAFVVFPVDHPLVTSTEVDRLIARFEAKPRGRTIFVAAHEDRRGHPVLLASSHRSAILELGDDEPLNNYIRLREGETEQVAMDNPGVVAGMNTSEEYERLLALYKVRGEDHGGPPA